MHITFFTVSRFLFWAHVLPKQLAPLLCQIRNRRFLKESPWSTTGLLILLSSCLDSVTPWLCLKRSYATAFNNASGWSDLLGPPPFVPGSFVLFNRGNTFRVAKGNFSVHLHWRCHRRNLSGLPQSRKPRRLYPVLICSRCDPSHCALFSSSKCHPLITPSLRVLCFPLHPQVYR